MKVDDSLILAVNTLWMLEVLPILSPSSASHQIPLDTLRYP